MCFHRATPLPPIPGLALVGGVGPPASGGAGLARLGRPGGRPVCSERVSSAEAIKGLKLPAAFSVDIGR